MVFSSIRGRLPLVDLCPLPVYERYIGYRRIKRMSTVATNKMTLCIQLRRVVEIFSSMIEMRKRQFERNLNDPRMILQLFSSVWRDNMNNKCNLRIYTVVHFNSFDKKTICDVNTLEAGWHHTVFSRHSSPNLYTITSLFESYIKHRG